MAATEELLLLLDRRLAALRKSRPELDDVLDLQEQLIRAAPHVGPAGAGPALSTAARAAGRPHSRRGAVAARSAG